MHINQSWEIHQPPCATAASKRSHLYTSGVALDLVTWLPNIVSCLWLCPHESCTGVCVSQLLAREYKGRSSIRPRFHPGIVAYLSLYAGDPLKQHHPRIVSDFCCFIASSNIFCGSRACFEPDVDSRYLVMKL